MESENSKERAAAFTELRYKAHKQIESDLDERVRRDPVPTPAEINAGAFREMIEPQVRDAVFNMRAKGYASASSGFGDETGEVQQIDGYFNIDEKTEAALSAFGVNVRRDEGFGPNYSFIQFSPEEPSLEKIKATWNQIVNILPDLGGVAGQSESGAAEDFIRQYALERTDILETINESRAQHENEQSLADAANALIETNAKNDRLTMERASRQNDQGAADAIRKDIG
jgi:hypothetical protein